MNYKQVNGFEIPMKVVVTTGITASGKSTWAKEYCANNPHWKRFNRDDIRAMLNGGDPWSHFKGSPENLNRVEELVTRLRDEFIIESLQSGFNVIVDDTNANSRTFNEVCRVLAKAALNVNVSEKAFYVDLQVALDRDRARTPSVGDDIVMKFWKRFKGSDFTNYFCKQTNIMLDFEKVECKGNIPAVICDLDGTLALFGNKNPFDRDFENDQVNEEVANILRGLNPSTTILFVSGRAEPHRRQTIQFLAKAKIDHWLLLMRKDNDKRNDAEVKFEIFRDSIAPNYDVKFVLDDRNRVVNMWRAQGLPCFQVAPGDF